MMMGKLATCAAHRSHPTNVVVTRLLLSTRHVLLGSVRCSIGISGGVCSVSLLTNHEVVHIATLLLALTQDQLLLLRLLGD